MKMDAATAQRTLGIIIQQEFGRTLEDTDKGPVVIWGACLLPIGCFDKHGEKGFVVDAITATRPDTLRRGLMLMTSDTSGARFPTWCIQNGLPPPDSKNVRKISGALVVDPASEEPVIYVDGVGEVEHGVWALANGVMVNGEFVPMERGTHCRTSMGTRVVFAPSLACEETCGSAPLDGNDQVRISEWAEDVVRLFNSPAPLVCAAWVRASVLRSRMESKDAQLPALYICGDSHRGKTLMATILQRMLGNRGESPHANMTSASNVGIFLAAASRSSLPFVIDEVKPYSGMGDNDLVKSLVNGETPIKSTRSGKLRSAIKIKSMPILVSEFVPADTGSITNRLFTMNLVGLSAHFKKEDVSNWVWCADRNHALYDHWSHSIYRDASVMTDEHFTELWDSARRDASVICDETCMTLNRSVTATTIALIGFKLLNRDAGGRLDSLYLDFCESLAICLRSMSRIIMEVSPIGRYISALRSGWASLEGRYSKLVCDRVFTYSEDHGLIVDHVTLHGILIDSRRLDPTLIGNLSTVAMGLEAEGFTKITTAGRMRGRHHMAFSRLSKQVWMHDLSRLLTVMDCSCAKMIAHLSETEE